VEVELLWRQCIPAIEKALAASLTLHCQEPIRLYVLQTDDSGVDIAAVVNQEVDQERSLRPRKCPSFRLGQPKNRPYLEGRRFLMRSDNKAPTWLQSA
jgi:hypothetical protein